MFKLGFKNGRFILIFVNSRVDNRPRPQIENISELNKPQGQHSPDKLTVGQGAGVGATAGAAVGSAWGPVGTAIGTAVGAVGGVIASIFID